MSIVRASVPSIEEALSVGICSPDESLQPIDFSAGSRCRRGLLLGCGQWPGELLGGEQLPEPFPLVFLSQVRDLDAHRGRVAKPQASHDVRGGRHVWEPERAARHQIEIGLRDAV